VKKILLIEDRVERQKKFTEDTGIDISSYSDILDNQTTLNKNILENYDTIVTHRSAYGNVDEDILGYLKEYCANTKTKLIFFSGGISSTYYSNIKYEFLLLNSKSFYSKNLKLFLDDFKTTNKANLLLLAYGTNWKINVMLNVLSKINLFISHEKIRILKKDNSDERVKFSKFKTQSNIDSISDIIEIKYPEITKGAINLTDLESISNDVKQYIQQEVEINV
jgi:hypothetical protein